MGKAKAMQASAGRRDAVFAHVPALIIGLAVLWDWVVQLNVHDWDGDINHLMYYGQRLLDGDLQWTLEFHDKLTVAQFLFWLPAKLDSFRAWQLMCMGACLIGGYSVYILLRGVFSSANGYAKRTGHYAGLYGGVFTLYLFSVLPGNIDHLNSLPTSLGLAAVALARHYATQSANNAKAVAVFLAGCLFASLAAGVRPYLAVFIGLIPVWASIATQLSRGGKVNYVSVGRFFLAWNACVALLLFCVEVLPYIVVGELGSFISGVETLRQNLKPISGEVFLMRQIAVLASMDPIAILLTFSWCVFAILLLKNLANTAKQSDRFCKSVAFDLRALVIIAPLSIQAMMLTKHFWAHYFQFFAPFISIGAAAFYVTLLAQKPACVDFLFRYKRTVALLVVILVSGPVSDLKTKIRTVAHENELAAANIATLSNKWGGG